MSDSNASDPTRTDAEVLRKQVENLKAENTALRRKLEAVRRCWEMYAVKMVGEAFKDD